MNKCDVIIPIYNAYDCLSPCIDSVIKNTDLNNNRLILIDDKSPDERVLPLLEKYANGKNIILLKNEKNKGFVGTVNKGMKYSTNDVLLLNSDTEVTNDWLKKIQEKAYSEPNIATVTPLSNNATLVSVPIGLQRNQLPENIDIETYGKMVEESAYDGVIDLPTSHGFCLFIKREALDAVGYFDEEKYGLGYGEETDFSFRCLDFGYRNILCQNTYILHKESQSFSEKREKLAKEHGEMIQKEYPIYNARIGYWCQTFPILKICENIYYQQELHDRKNILMVIHDWNDVENNLGGTTMHVYDIIKKIRNKINVHVLYPQNGIYKLKSYFKNSEKELKFGAIDSCNNIPMNNHIYKDMIENIITALRIDTIHIHHMIGHCMDIIDVAKEYNVYSMITLHDYYSVCPTINMLYNMETFCENIKNPDCKNCIKSKTLIQNNIIPKWRNNWYNFLKKFDKVIVPTKSVEKIISKYYKDIKYTVIEHGIDIENSDYVIDLSSHEKKNIAFVGVMVKHKGAEILENMIKNSSNYTFHLFGESQYEPLSSSKGCFVYHGRYNRNDLPTLLKDNNIDLVCMLSITPETFSYTLSEVSAAGVPVLSFDIGALGERINRDNLGWTLKYTNDYKKVLSKIDDIFGNEKQYYKVVNDVVKHINKSTSDMAEDYYDIYKKNSSKIDKKKSYKSLQSVLEKNYEVKESVVSQEALAIMNSIRWKIASKIRVPNFIKKIIKKVIK